MTENLKLKKICKILDATLTLAMIGLRPTLFYALSSCFAEKEENK